MNHKRQPEQKQIQVSVYLLNGNVYVFNVKTLQKAREYAARIRTEGFFIDADNPTNEDSEEIHYPITQIYKIKIS